MTTNTALQDAALPPRVRTRRAGRTAREVQVETLKQIIEQHAAGGVRRGGHLWAALPQPALLDELNAHLPGNLRIGIRTLRDLTRQQGIVNRRALVGGKVTCILRLGEPDPVAPNEVATERLVRVLASTWRRRAGRVPTARDYGLIRELAKGVPEEEVPPDAMPTILSWTIRNWSAFMAGARFDPRWRGKRYFRFPSLAVIVKFRSAAIEGYRTFVVEPAMTREWEAGPGTPGRGCLAESFRRESHLDSTLPITNKSLKKDSAIGRVEDPVAGKAGSGVSPGGSFCPEEV